jgi:hypothetical protein
VTQYGESLKQYQESLRGIHQDIRGTKRLKHLLDTLLYNIQDDPVIIEGDKAIVTIRDPTI